MNNHELFRMIHQAITESNEELRSNLTEKIEVVRMDLTEKIEGVRMDLTEKIEGVRTELIAKIDEIHPRLDKFDDDMDYLKAKMHEHDREIFSLKKRSFV